MMSTSARRQAGAAESCAPPTQNTDTRSNSTNTLPTSQTAELQQTVGEWGAPHGEAWAHAIVLVLSCPALGRATFWDDSRVQGPDCTVSLPTAAFNFCFMFLTQSRTNHMVVEIMHKLAHHRISNAARFKREDWIDLLLHHLFHLLHAA